MFDTQMEMSFEAAAGHLVPRRRRLTRAQWWFQRMRQLVDRAVDWAPIPEPRPEQMWLPNTRRAVRHW
jgi:hypothetical protein